MNWNLNHLPFTAAGSWTRIMLERRTGRLLISSARILPNARLTEGQWAQNYYEVALLRAGAELPYTVAADEACLRLTRESGSAAIAFAADDTLAIESDALDVRLLPCHGQATVRRLRGDMVQANDFDAMVHHQVRAAPGTALKMTPGLTVSGEKGRWNNIPMTFTFSGRGVRRGAIRFPRFDAAWPGPVTSVADAIRIRQREWKRWRKAMPQVADAYRGSAEVAWHQLLNCQVAPEGGITRRAILMSKMWMNQVWSWDNCFVALAVARADPELAFDQLRLFFDTQSPSGTFADSVNSLAGYYGFVKPPIWGWTMMRLRDLLGVKAIRAFCREAYEPMSRQAMWWYDRRDSDADGMCEYHHGNDSGWDNSTAFDQGMPTEGADLAAHLVLQTECLSWMAGLLGRRVDAARWRKRSQRQLADLLRQGVKGGRFVSPMSGKRSADPTLSLLNCIPAVLGARLPKPILGHLVTDLSPGGPFLTEYGLATESPSSAKFDGDGYWRGPIWAPSTYLIFDGLLAAGHTDLARTIAQRFCDMCARDNGMWENYNPLTGKGLRASAYTWTSAVFILLAEWLGRDA
jgi:hypothetical protein